MGLRTVLIYVNSQFGLGHFQRCYCILKELEHAHPDVLPVVLYGGLPFEKFSTLKRAVSVRLPGLSFQSADGNVDFRPRPIDHGRSLCDVFVDRRNAISTAVQGRDVAVVFLEYFPFSKQFLESEVRFLLGEVSEDSVPTVVCSTRDYVTIDRGFDTDFADDFVETCSDYVFVHADPRFAELQSSYGPVDRFADKIRYTGFVVDSGLLERHSRRLQPIVAVSMGGGRDGSRFVRVFRDAVSAIPSREATGVEHRVFPGPHLPLESHEAIVKLSHQLPDHRISVCRFEDYRATLSSCLASLSMCGYNTAFELIAMGVPHVGFLPRNRTEQLMRSSMLTNNGVAQELHSTKDVTAFLRQCRGLSLSLSPRESVIDLGGAARTADLLSSLARGQRV